MFSGHWGSKVAIYRSIGSRGLKWEEPMALNLFRKNLSYQSSHSSFCELVLPWMITRCEETDIYYIITSCEQCNLSKPHTVRTRETVSNVILLYYVFLSSSRVFISQSLKHMQNQDVFMELILANRCGIWSWRELVIEIPGDYSRVNHQFTESFENSSYSNFWSCVMA